MPERDIKAEQRRLAILQFLKDDPDYKVNDALLLELLASIGFGVSKNVLSADLMFLEESQLVSTSDIAGCTLVILRGNGYGVATGVSVIPGIARPRPE
ncbi:MAG: ArsR family transcriptional regulator [Methylomarinum sp.]|nr:ArsR family transcriptional regulator [Methylomarinum sp.]